MNIPAKPDAIAQAYATDRFLYLDIETIPCQSPEYAEKVAEGITPPGNIKKPESIEKWLEENRDDAAKEALAKTSFDGGRGHVCTIAWAKNAGDVQVVHAKTIADERSILADFFADFDPYHKEIPVGHNLAGFDLPFLRKRAIALGVKMPPRNFPRDPKPWDRSIFDTMAAWAGGKNHISMNELCDILGIEGKDGFDGSQVAEAWANGEHDKIAEYCADDVRRTRAIHQRFIEAGY